MGRITRASATRWRWAAAAVALASGVLGRSAQAQCGDYTIVPGPATYISASVDIGSHGDEVLTTISLPFDVTVYGTSYSTAAVSSNGFVQFGTSGQSYQPECLPTAATGDGPAIYAWWTDLYTTNGGVYTSVSGGPGNQVFVIEWRASTDGGTPNVQFEIIFYEGQSHFDLVYGLAANTSANTVGVQASSAGPATTYECHTVGTTSLSTGLSLRFECVAGGAGACCAADGVCVVTSRAACDASKQFAGGGTTCETSCDLLLQCFSYVFQNGPATYIAGTTDIGNHGTDAATPVFPPFPIPIYGTTYSMLMVYPDGYLAPLPFSPPTGENRPLPTSTLLSVPAILPFWLDQTTANTTTQGIFTTVTGMSGSRTFVIEWRTGTFFSTAAQCKYEVIFYEGQTFFDVVYGTPLNATGALASTTGVQRNGSSGTQYTHNAAGPAPGRSLRYTCAGGVRFAPGGEATVADSSGDGNSNGLADPGETALAITLPVLKVDSGSSADLVGNLSSLTPTATVISGASVYPTMTGGLVASNTDPFVISVSPSHVCNTPIIVRLRLTQAGGGEGVVDFSVPVCGAMYCAAGGNNCVATTNGEMIDRVAFNTIDNVSSSTSGDVGCYTDFTPISTVLVPGQTYPILVHNGNRISQDRCVSWFDWNHDKVFDRTEQVTINSDPNNLFETFLANVTVPVTAAPGPTRMRIRLTRQDTNLSICGTNNFGEVEDYTVIVNSTGPGACCMEGSRICTIVPAHLCTGSYHGNGSLCSPNPCEGTCCIAGSGVCSITLPGDCAGDFTAGATCAPTNPCGGACCGAGGICTATVASACSGTFHHQAVCSPDLCAYCIAGASACNGGALDEVITRVIFNSIDVSSPSVGPAGCYTNNTAISTRVLVGSSYQLTVHNGGPNLGGDRGTAWIDWNHDLIFDGSEGIELEPDGNSLVFTANIVVPAAAVTTSTRMRIRLSYQDASNPCDSVTYGEVEDYTLIVDPAFDACCRGTTCVPVATGSCTGTVAGSNALVVSSCGTGNTIATCCYADFNHDGSTTIDDLFLYLNAYFTGAPWANIGGDGIEAPTIDDLFLYINAYFTGCI